MSMTIIFLNMRKRCFLPSLWDLMVFVATIQTTHPLFVYPYNVTFFFMTPVIPGGPTARDPLQPMLQAVAQQLKEMYPFLEDNNFEISVVYYGNESFDCSNDIGLLMADFYQPYFKHEDQFPSDYSDSFLSATFNLCSEDLALTSGNWARETKILLMTDAADSQLSDKTLYPTTINLNASPDMSYIRALHAMITLYGWTQIAYVCSPPVVNSGPTDFPADLCGKVEVLFDVIDQFSEPVNYEINSLIILPLDGSTDLDYNTVLANKMLTGSRAILLLLIEEELKQFMVHAARKGMTNGDYVFFSPQHVFFNGTPKTASTLNDMEEGVTAEALRSLLIISETSVAHGSEMMRSFLERVDQVSVSEYNLTERPVETDRITSIRFADSFFLMAQVLNRTWTEVPNMTSESFVQQTMNNTYILLSGTVSIDVDGNLVIPVMILRYNMTSRSWEGSFLCHLDSFKVEFLPNSDTSWFGWSRLPGDIPYCGLHNENCSFLNHPEWKYGPAIGVLLPLSLVALFLLVLRKRYYARRYGHLFLDSWTTVQFPDGDSKTLDLLPDVVFGGIRASAKMVLAINGSPSQFIHRTVHNVKFWTLLLTVHDAKHKNLTTFYGLTFRRTPGQCFFVAEYCEKGALRHLIKSNVLLTDIQFRLAFIRDIAEGVHFLHKSAVTYHGDLSMLSCLADGRFSVKISHSGYSQILDAWMRRDGLRKAVQHEQAEDLKGYGSILNELITTASAEETTVAAKSLDELSAKLEFAVNSCLQSDESQRPKASAMLQLIRQFTGRNYSIVERLLKKVAQYAATLQETVADRTKALVEETGKVDALLLEMLPQHIIQKLRNQELIEAELYDSATVLFSDIPVFSALVNDCTPLTVVEFLNAVYSMLDDALAPFDAYKVETINDSYLVTSGIPVRNGSKHAAEICSVALALRRVAWDIRILAVPDVRVHLRIGINTGSVATGVVGTRMPRYCLFGDAMNTASRMESHGEPDCIHVGESTVVLVQRDRPDEFIFESRGLVQIKGKGKIPTFWLVSVGETLQESQS